MDDEASSAGPDETSAALVVSVATQLTARLDDIISAMTDMFIDVIPEFRHDDSVRNLMVASTAANVATILEMLRLELDAETISVPPAAAEYARRFAQHELSLEALLRAYRLGEHSLEQSALELIEHEATTVADALGAVSLFSVRTNHYIDTVIEALIDIYEDERRRWDARSDALRTSRVLEVIARPDLDAVAASARLGLSMDQWHLAAVAWLPSGASDATSTRLRTAAAVLAIGTDLTPYVVSVDDVTTWMWVSSPRPIDLDLDAATARLGGHPDVVIALGDQASGLAGFRQTLDDARRVQTLAQSSPMTNRLVQHRDLGIATLVADDIAGAQRWARRHLGPLGANTASGAKLRETLRVFLLCQGSYSDAASALDVHKNTVLYRVQKAEQLLGVPVSANRLVIEVALEIDRRLRR